MKKLILFCLLSFLPLNIKTNLDEKVRVAIENSDKIALEKALKDQIFTLDQAQIYVTFAADIAQKRKSNISSYSFNRESFPGEGYYILSVALGVVAFFPLFFLYLDWISDAKDLVYKIGREQVVHPTISSSFKKPKGYISLSLLILGSITSALYGNKLHQKHLRTAKTPEQKYFDSLQILMFLKQIIAKLDDKKE